MTAITTSSPKLRWLSGASLAVLGVTVPAQAQTVTVDAGDQHVVTGTDVLDIIEIGNICDDPALGDYCGTSVNATTASDVFTVSAVLTGTADGQVRQEGSAIGTPGSVTGSGGEGAVTLTMSNAGSAGVLVRAHVFDGATGTASAAQDVRARAEVALGTGQGVVSQEADGDRANLFLDNDGFLTVLIDADAANSSTQPVDATASALLASGNAIRQEYDHNDGQAGRLVIDNAASGVMTVSLDADAGLVGQGTARAVARADDALIEQVMEVPGTGLQTNAIVNLGDIDLYVSADAAGFNAVANASNETAILQSGADNLIQNGGVIDMAVRADADVPSFSSAVAEAVALPGTGILQLGPDNQISNAASASILWAVNAAAGAGNATPLNSAEASVGSSTGLGWGIRQMQYGVGTTADLQFINAGRVDMGVDAAVVGGVNASVGGALGDPLWAVAQTGEADVNNALFDNDGTMTVDYWARAASASGSASVDGGMVAQRFYNGDSAAALIDNAGTMLMFARASMGMATGSGAALVHAVGLQQESFGLNAELRAAVALFRPLWRDAVRVGRLSGRRAGWRCRGAELRRQSLAGDAGRRTRAVAVELCGPVGLAGRQ